MSSGHKSNAPPLVFVRRGKHRIVEHFNPILGPIARQLMLGQRRYEWLRFFPRLPRWINGWAKPPVWPDVCAETPPELRSYAGIVRDPHTERRAFAETPLHDFTKTHARSLVWGINLGWPFMLPCFPRLAAALRHHRSVRDRVSKVTRRHVDPPELARMIRAEAKRIGISEVGFAKADIKYTFAESPDPGDANIIVCVLEQDWRATQTAPSAKAERAAFRAYSQQGSKVARLVTYLQDLGYRARPNDLLAQDGITIYYGVEAGLGQLGLNGQLLTPTAGSRARLALITTDAPVELGRPVDYGIPRICDECKLCVRRCPSGAIPIARREKRGVVKVAIKPERCFPLVVQAHGCAVCMKVCPIQRYGLVAVTEHFVETGTILGKGSHELEGYLWPHDGRYYGPGEKPRMTSEFLQPDGFEFDKDRKPPTPEYSEGRRRLA